MKDDYTDPTSIGSSTTGTGLGLNRDDDRYTGDTLNDKAVDSGIDSGKRKRRVLSAGTLAGDRVRNSAGEDLGSIEEIMIDLPSGRVAYAVLSFGGFLGMGSKLFAVPWESLSLNEDDHEFVLDVDRQTLENAPGFDKDNWPDMADPDWSSQIHGHYGQEPYWKKDRSSDTTLIESSSRSLTQSGDYIGDDTRDMPTRDRTYDVNAKNDYDSDRDRNLGTGAGTGPASTQTFSAGSGDYKEDLKS